jgi:two-component system response regulator AtoC
MGPASSRELALVVSTASGVVSVPLPDKDEVTIGRAVDCDVVINDASISRVHAIITRSPASIRDGGSRHGTVILGQRLHKGERAPLPVGAVIELGQSTLVLVRAAPPPTSAAISENLVVADAAMRKLYGTLDVIAPSPLAVLVQGETGTGKELFARAVHARSPRAAKALVTLNCAAVPEALLESQLFGHERGAFTGATGRSPGLFETADGGTLFLDEVGDLAPATQSKLLRVLESGEVTPVGSVRPRHVDVRIVAATHRDLAGRIAEGLFRADLLYRLDGFVVTLPPLRDRVDDIMPLAALFARRMTERLGRDAAPTFAQETVDALKRYPWPGNVRELRHVVERAVVLCSTQPVVDVEHLMLPATLPRATDAVRGTEAPTVPPPDGERERIVEALRGAYGNQTTAAGALGISRQTLLKKLDRFGLGRPRKGPKS